MFYNMEVNLLVFILILFSMRREVNAFYDPDLPEVETDSEIDDDLVKEKGLKWSINLGDMLNFFKSDEEVRVKENQSTSGRDNSGGGQTAEGIIGNVQNKGGGEDEEPPKEYDENYERQQAVKKIMESKPYQESMENLPVDYRYDDDLFHYQIKDYIIRYVNLFLYVLHLKDYNPPVEEDKEFIVSFDFTISKKDLQYLQTLTSRINRKNIFDELDVIDEILEKGLYKKEKYSFFEDVRLFLKTSGFSEWLKSKNAYIAISMLTAFFMLSIKHRVGFSYKFIIFVLLNNLVIMEGLFTYWIKMKEAEIEDHVERMKLQSMPEACNMENRSFFTKVYNWFYEDECLVYHKALQINRADKIFPLESMYNAYSFYLIELPIKVCGSAFREFTASVNDYLPPVLRPFGTAFTQVICFSLICFVIFCALCPFVKISFLGARLELGFPRWIRYRRHPEVGPPEYNRVRDLPRSEIREMEKEYVQHPPDYLEGSDSVSEVIKQTGKVEHRQVEENPAEENNDKEIVNEDVRNDSESLTLEEGNLSKDIEAAKRLLAELKKNE